MKRFASILYHARAWQPTSRQALVRYSVARERNVARNLTDEDHVRAAAAWLARAQDATRDGGVVGRYRLDTGWTSSYPETTGYLIPTFLELAELPGLGEFRDRARRAIRFLLDVQLPSGAFPGGEVHENRTEPSIFNTAQILCGLHAWLAAEPDPEVLASARRAADWLVSMQDADGAWRRHVYLGIPTTYSAHASCWLAGFGRFIGDDRYVVAAQRHLEWVMGHVDPETGWFDLAGFDESAHRRRDGFTHTIAYTLWGALETASITGSTDAIDAVARAAWEIARRFELRGWLPGVLDRNWRGRSSFECVTGTAQMALIWCRLAEIRQDARFLNAALKAVDAVKAAQIMERESEDLFGGIPGSDPVWGDYISLAFPNWAAKFFIDAVLACRRTCESKLPPQRAGAGLPRDVPVALPPTGTGAPRRLRVVLYAGPDSRKAEDMLRAWASWGFEPHAIVVERGTDGSAWQRLRDRIARSGVDGVIAAVRRRVRPEAAAQDGDGPAETPASGWEALRTRGILVLEVESLSRPQGVEVVRALAPDVAVHAGAGILRKELLGVPKLATLNAHMGVLPRYRGMNVAEWAVLEGGPVGCTVHVVDEGIDTGPILLVRPCAPDSPSDIGSLRSVVDREQLRALGDVLQWIHATGALPPARPQTPVEGRQYFRLHARLRAAVEALLQRANAGTPRPALGNDRAVATAPLG